jgi:hypothetical protein
LYESLYQDCIASGGRAINESGAVGRIRIGGGNQDNLRKPSPLLLRLPQVIYDLTLDQTRTAGFELNLVFAALRI